MHITIKRGKYLNFYTAPNFSLSVEKKTRTYNHLTFMLGDDSSYEFTTVLVSRREAAHTLKKFKKVLAKQKQKA